MNIFVLDKDPANIVRHYCDLHVNKMLLESCQMLCAVFPDAPYRRTHYNHPCSKWARHSTANYQWLLALANELSMEYTRRRGRIHKCDEVVDWLNNQTEEDYVPRGRLTAWPQCMPDQFKCSNPVKAYKRYYGAKLNDFIKRGIFTYSLQK